MAKGFHRALVIKAHPAHSDAKICQALLRWDYPLQRGINDLGNFLGCSLSLLRTQ